MIRRRMRGEMSKAERMGVLLELARLRATDLVNIVGNTDDTLALLDWLRDEAEEAALEDQTSSCDGDEPLGDMFGWNLGEAE